MTTTPQHLAPTIDHDPYRLVGEVFARYVRAADHRDPDRMAALFDDEATVTIHHRGDGVEELLAELTGAATIGAAVTVGMAPHPPRGWSHHTAINPITTVAGDDATYDAQFSVYSVRGAARPARGWPAEASGAQGDITAIESGYLTAELRRTDAGWRITKLVIRHDLPYAFPTS